MAGDKKAIIHKYGFLTVEIGTNFLKISYIKIRNEKVDIVDLTTIDISRSLEDAIVEKIKQAVSGIKGLKKAEVVNVIPSNQIIFKNIEIPSTDMKEIGDIIDLQAGRHTPYSRDEIIIDYMNLGTVHNSYTKILLIIVKKDIVSKRYDIIKKAGFKVDKTILAAEALTKYYARSPIRGDSRKPVAIVNIDSDHTDFIVGHVKNSLYIRSIPVGGNSAEEDKEGTKHKFFEELKRSLESYQSENIDDTPEKIYYTGVSGWMSGADSELKELTGIEGFIVSQSRMLGITGDTPMDDGAKASTLSVVAPSLVFDELELDLIPEDIKIMKKLKRRAREMARVGLFSMVSIVVFCTILLTNMVFKNLFLQKLSSSYNKEIREADKLKMTSEKTHTIESFLDRKGESLNILTELFNALPGEVFLNSLNLKDDDTLTFTATTDNMSRVFSLVTDLENNDFFSNVKVDSTRSRRVDEKEVADFGLTLAIEKDI